MCTRRKRTPFRFKSTTSGHSKLLSQLPRTSVTGGPTFSSLNEQTGRANIAEMPDFVCAFRQRLKIVAGDDRAYRREQKSAVLSDPCLVILREAKRCAKAEVTLLPGLTDLLFTPVSFNNFGLSPEVVRGTQAMGFSEPTPIQLRAFPIILSGKDLNRHRANRHRQNGGLRAANHDPARQARRLSLSRARADARARGASRDGLSRLRALHRSARLGRARRRRLRQAEGRSGRAAPTSSARRPAGCSICSNNAR